MGNVIAVDFGKKPQAAKSWDLSFVELVEMMTAQTMRMAAMPAKPSDAEAVEKLQGQLDHLAKVVANRHAAGTLVEWCAELSADLVCRDDLYELRRFDDADAVEIHRQVDPMLAAYALAGEMIDAVQPACIEAVEMDLQDAAAEPTLMAAEGLLRLLGNMLAMVRHRVASGAQDTAFVLMLNEGHAFLADEHKALNAEMRELIAGRGLYKATAQ